ncbi:anti-sigma factor family protein [Albidovulum sediminis]|mgnify:CR=1 FL=1|jgi:anti-sigma factor RsiW|uniref:Anti-sigma factor n=1 Tax=Albidovulum sediminis TaxID=3066345 RepID=A0ABT2NRJ5_9RHOB|nr:anti-sigma factor [Defluviimonas sediminis]MCT8331567.1 anti-sigma factor [Defluviimonas sediminis]
MSDQTALTEAELLDFAAGQLPADAMSALVARLADDPAARATLAEWQRQDAAIEALYQPVAREPVPYRLTDVIRRAEAEDSAKANGRPQTRLWLVAATIAALAVGTGAGWFARDLTSPAPMSQTLAANAMRAYDTYVVEVAHPVEVAASDADHLNAWMSKRLGHETRPPDFAAAGFTLMGGRIVPSEQGAAALYMYDNAQGERITLYIAPQGASSTTAFQFAQEGATSSFYWMDRDLSYAVVGTVPREVLRSIALAAYDQLI